MGPGAAVAAVRRAVRDCVAGLGRGELVLVACSGGADSLALAVATAFEAPRAGLRAGAVTVDHGLQDGSGERAEAVRALLTGLGLHPVEIVAADVEAGSATGPEAAARAARYRALDDAADRLGAAVVLVGHTLDDQAETVLLGLARGSGGRSLSGMATTRGRYRRPLLGLPRETVHESLRAAPVPVTPWQDPHNADPSFTRTRARHEVLPALERALGPGVAAALARTAAQLRDDADALDGWARRARDEARVGRDGQDDLDGLAVAVLAELPTAVRTRVLRQAALAAGSPPTDLRATHVADMDRLVTGWHGQGPLHLPGRVRVARCCGTLALTRDDERVPGTTVGE